MEQDFQVYEFQIERSGLKMNFVFEAMGMQDANRHREEACAYFRDKGVNPVNAAELVGPLRVDGPESMRQHRWVAEEPAPLPNSVY